MVQMGKRIHDMRKQWQYTLDEVAELVDIPKATLSRLENGKLKTINRSYIDRLANLFNCDAAYLMGYEDSPKVDLIYSAPGKEDVKVTVDAKPIIGEESLRVKVLQEASKIRPENLAAAIDILKSLQ